MISSIADPSAEEKSVRSMAEGAVVTEALTKSIIWRPWVSLHRLLQPLGPVLKLNPAAQAQSWLLGSHQPETQLLILRDAPAKLPHPKPLLHARIRASPTPVCLVLPMYLFTRVLSSLCYCKAGKSEKGVCGLFIPRAETQIAVPPIFTVFLYHIHLLTIQK